MPRERVFGASRPYTDVSSAQSVVGVTWSKEAGHVQVFVELFNDDLKYAVGSDAEGAIPAVATGEEETRRKLWAEGFYVDLERAGLNELIRNLRRARDQAFGRDE